MTAASTDCDAASLVEFVTLTSDSPELEPGYEEERRQHPSGLPDSGFRLGWNRRNRGVWFDWSSARRAERKLDRRLVLLTFDTDQQ